MDEAVKHYIDQFEEKLTKDLLKILTEKGLLKGKLLESEDINEVWERDAPEYMVDSVKEIAKYPNVALGWAMYFGMAVARYWDTDMPSRQETGI